MKKYVIFSIIIIFTIIIVSAVLINKCLDPYYRPNKEKMEKYFERDKNDICLIVDYFSNSSYSSLSFNFPNIRANIDRFKVTDDLVLEAISRLLDKQGYSAIGKKENTIYFQKWTRFTDAGVGIAYSINKIDEPELQYLTELEPLSENGWYYYVDDYSEWRANH